MAINEKVTDVHRDGTDVVLHTESTDFDAESKRVIRDASIEPKVGDLLHFGSAGTEQPDGSIFGGSGFIAMDGNEFPYRRVSHTELVEDW